MMKVLTGVLAAVLLGFIYPIEGSAGSFWSLAVQEGLVDHEGQFSPANCTAFLVKGIIQPYQYRVCRNNSYLLSAIARGLRRAVSACRNSFQKARWNCTAFEGTYLLGRAIETKESKEAAYIRTLISAAITFDIATSCREKKIPNCPCAADFPYYVFEDDIVKIGGCSDNYRYAVDVNKAFTEGHVSSESEDLSSFIRKHNNQLGRKIVNVTFDECKCHGPTGSCNIKICYRRLHGFSEASRMTFDKYTKAVRIIHTRQNATTPSLVARRLPKADDMMYLEPSPNYCEPDPELNIIGTHDRQCDPTISGYGSCDVLCCGRGYYRKTRKVPRRSCTPKFNEETGEFSVDCHVVGYDEDVDYFCN